MRGADNQAVPGLAFLVAAIGAVVFVMAGLAAGLAELAIFIAHAVRALGGGGHG